jgi:hypothetical protein
MNKTARPQSLILVFSLLILATFGMAQQKKAATPAPLPTQILSAKRIFISNSPGDFAPDGDFGDYGPYRPYNDFYASFKDWGYYELVSRPADADLVFEIQFVERPVASNTNSPQFLLTIVDPKTRIPLWWIAQTIQRGNRASTSEKNYEQAMANLVDDVKKLATPSNLHTDTSKE